MKTQKGNKWKTEQNLKKKTRSIENKENAIHLFSVCFFIAFRLRELMLPGRRSYAQKCRLRRAFVKDYLLWAAGKAQDSGCKKKKVKLYWNKIEETNEKN